MGLSRTIVRLMVFAGVSAGGFSAVFFQENAQACMHVCMCVYICVYTYKKGHSICYIPKPDPDRPDPEGSSPIVYSIVCASVTIALVFGLPLFTMKV